MLNSERDKEGRARRPPDCTFACDIPGHPCTPLISCPRGFRSKGDRKRGLPNGSKRASLRARELALLFAKRECGQMNLGGMDRREEAEAQNSIDERVF